MAPKRLLLSALFLLPAIFADDRSFDFDPQADFSLFKIYTFVEKVKAQFRVEVFNLTNTPQFYGPQTNLNSTTFGKITQQANFSRIFQLGVRFEF